MAERLRQERRGVKIKKSEKQQQRKCAPQVGAPSLVLRFVDFRSFCHLTRSFSHLT
jgi:hypothetical protein